MSLLPFAGLPAWAVPLGLGAHLAVGIGLGFLYFRGLWWNARLFAESGRVATTVALMLGRFALLGGLMTLASLEGALPLLMLALGVLVGRSAVMREARAELP